MSSPSSICSWRQTAKQAAGLVSGLLLLLTLSCARDHGLESKDTVPPSRIYDLHCVEVDLTGVLLSWTAPGDDGSSGTAAVYDVRYSTSPIDTLSWDSATQASTEPSPLPAQSQQSFRVTGLSPDSVYYFATRAADSVSNWSVLSNVAIGDLTPPVIGFFDPLEYDAVSGIMTMPATASDNHMVQRVEFYVDGCLRYVDSVAPWVYYWNCATIGDGTNHTIEIKAYDAAGNSSLPEQTEVIVHSSYIDEDPPNVSLTAFGHRPPSIRITFRDDGSGIDWDSVYVDLYSLTGNYEDFLPISRLLRTWTPEDFVPAVVPCNGTETEVNLWLDDMMLADGQRILVVVYGGVRIRRTEETCTCDVYTYDYVRGGVRDLAGNHTEVVDELLTVYHPGY